MEKLNHEPTGGSLGLEEIVHIANKVGLEYVDAKKKSDRLILLKASIRAKIVMRHDDGKLSEAKLQRLADLDNEYMEYLESLSEAKKETERLKVRYESYKNLFEAKRSLLSYQKAEMKLI